MRSRVPAVAVVAAVIAGVSWACEPARSATNPIPPPGFNTPASTRAAPDPLRRDTLLPTDYAGLLTGSLDMTALLGQPIGSLDAHAIVGLPSASVGQLERLSCTYTLAGHNRPILVTEYTGATSTSPTYCTANADSDAGRDGRSACEP